MKACGKVVTMRTKSIITKHRTDIGELKDIENAIGRQEKRDAMLDYIVACDYPEVFEDEAEVIEDEQNL